MAVIDDFLRGSEQLAGLVPRQRATARVSPGQSPGAAAISSLASEAGNIADTVIGASRLNSFQKDFQALDSNLPLEQFQPTAMQLFQKHIDLAGFDSTRNVFGEAARQVGDIIRSKRNVQAEIRANELNRARVGAQQALAGARRAQAIRTRSQIGDGVGLPIGGGRTSAGLFTGDVGIRSLPEAVSLSPQEIDFQIDLRKAGATGRDLSPARRRQIRTEIVRLEQARIQREKNIGAQQRQAGVPAVVASTRARVRRRGARALTQDQIEEIQDIDTSLESGRLPTAEAQALLDRKNELLISSGHDPQVLSVTAAAAQPAPTGVAPVPPATPTPTPTPRQRRSVGSFLERARTRREP